MLLFELQLLLLLLMLMQKGSRIEPCGVTPLLLLLLLKLELLMMKCAFLMWRRREDAKECS